MIDWKPLGGRRTGNDSDDNSLPGIRGVRQIHIPELVSQRYVHFSWWNESFCIRDYLGDREVRQSSTMKASDVWRMRKGPVFSYRHTSNDIPYWKQKLQEITRQELE